MLPLGIEGLTALSVGFVVERDGNYRSRLVARENIEGRLTGTRDRLLGHAVVGVLARLLCHVVVSVLTLLLCHNVGDESLVRLLSRVVSTVSSIGHLVHAPVVGDAGRVIGSLSHLCL